MQNAGLAEGASTLLARGGSAAVIGAKASTIGCLGLDGPTSPAMTSFALGSQ